MEQQEGMSQRESPDKEVSPEEKKRFEDFMVKLYEHGKDKVKILAVTLGPADKASPWYRVVQPLSHLGAQHKLSISTLISERPPHPEMIRWCDVLFVQQVKPYFKELVKFAQRRLKKPVVFETDDWVPEMPTGIGYQHRDVFKSWGAPELYKWMLHNCESVHASSEYLAELCGQYHTNSEVMYFPNAIDFSDISWREPKIEHDMIHLGYLGSMSHVDDINEVKEVLIEFLKKNRNVKLIFSGIAYKVRIFNDKTGEFINANYEDLPLNHKKACQVYWLLEYFKDVPKEQIEFREWEPIDKYGELYSDIDFAIAPLCNNKFNRSKSSLKMIEAGAYSVPLIAADIEPYQRIKHGVDGFLVSKRRKWASYLHVLASDREKREAMGDALGRKVRKQFDIKDWSDKRHEFFMQFMKRIMTV